MRIDLLDTPRVDVQPLPAPSAHQFAATLRPADDGDAHPRARADAARKRRRSRSGRRRQIVGAMLRTKVIASRQSPPQSSASFASSRTERVSPRNDVAAASSALPSPRNASGRNGVCRGGTKPMARQRMQRRRSALVGRRRADHIGGSESCADQQDLLFTRKLQIVNPRDCRRSADGRRRPAPRVWTRAEDCPVASTT